LAYKIPVFISSNNFISIENKPNKQLKRQFLAYEEFKIELSRLKIRVKFTVDLQMGLKEVRNRAKGFTDGLQK